MIPSRLLTTSVTVRPVKDDPFTSLILFLVKDVHLWLSFHDICDETKVSPSAQVLELRFLLNVSMLIEKYESLLNKRPSHKYFIVGRELYPSSCRCM